jgi:hypothetical protein
MARVQAAPLTASQKRNELASKAPQEAIDTTSMQQARPFPTPTATAAAVPRAQPAATKAVVSAKPAANPAPAFAAAKPTVVPALQQSMPAEGTTHGPGSSVETASAAADAPPLPSQSLSERARTSAPDELVQSVTGAFHAIDLDKSGTLTRGEIIRACREQERVRLLLGLPRNLRQGDGSKQAFEAIFARLDSDESAEISLAEFLKCFTAPDMRSAAAAAAEPPSWVAAAASAPLEVDGDVGVRARHGFVHFQSEGRFEHTQAEWLEERDESGRSVSTEMEQWGVADRQTLSEAEYGDLVAKHKKHITEQSAFDARERAEQRAKVEDNLRERLLHIYRPEPADLQKLVVATRLDPPLQPLTQPLAPHGASALASSVAEVL